VKIFEGILGHGIGGISYHCPTRCGYPFPTEYLTGLGLYEAYDDFFTKDMKYISDSSGWREGCLCEWIGIEDKIVALMHQIHWYRESPVETF
jgi:hypothetical protein